MLARLLVTGAVDVAVFVALARALRISEVTEVLDLLGRRLPLPGVSRRS